MSIGGFGNKESDGLSYQDRHSASVIRSVSTVGGVCQDVVKARYRNGRCCFITKANPTGWSVDFVLYDGEVLADALNDRFKFQHIELASPWYAGEFTAESVKCRLSL